MLTAPDFTWRVITPPKTASTTLIALLQQEPFNAQYSGWQHDGDQIQGTMIVSVRSPFDRAVSLWRHSLNERKVDHEQYPFRAFMEDVLAGKLNEFYSFTIHRWLRGCSRIDKLLHFERLAEDLRDVLPQYDWRGIEIPHQNKNPVLSAASPLLTDRWARPVIVVPDPLVDAANRDLVCQWASDDFALFGYPRERAQ